MEAKDLYTGGHTGRVAAVSIALAEHLGYDSDALEAIEIGALLHDIGKIGIPEHILRKEGPLDEGEWAVMRMHPLISDFILAELDLDPIIASARARVTSARMGRAIPTRSAARRSRCRPASFSSPTRSTRSRPTVLTGRAGRPPPRSRRSRRTPAPSSAERRRGARGDLADEAGRSYG